MRRRRNALPGTLPAFCFLAVYTTAFWGAAGRYLPPPFNDWYDLPYRLLGPAWHRALPSTLGHDVQLSLYQVVEALLLGCAVPILVLQGLGCHWRQAGGGAPVRHGLGTTFAGLIFAVPAGYLLVAHTALPAAAPAAEVLLYLLLPPEHFLVFGVPLVLAHGEPATSPAAGERFAPLAVLAGSTTIFALVHAGAAESLVFWSSIPLGALFSVMTLASGSIWPAVAAHVALNLVPALLPLGP